MMLARLGPSPNTVCVPHLNRSQPRQPFAAARSFVSVGRGGMKSAAEPVGFAVSLGFVMLLSVLLQTMMSWNGPAVDVGIVLVLWRTLRFLATAVLSVQVLDERGVGLVAVFSFSVILCALTIVVF
jgi:hypothetical protein